MVDLSDRNIWEKWMKNIVISDGQIKINGIIAQYLSEKGHNVILLCGKEPTWELETDCFCNESNYEIKVSKMDSEEVVGVLCKEIEEKYGNIDVLIHGINDFDDECLLEHNSTEFAEYVKGKLKEIFLLSKGVANEMIKKKEGLVLYPMFYDCLSVVGYPVSPVISHAKISMMKCLARELNAFKVRSNAITFGYYNDNFSKEEVNRIKKEIEIFALKPKLHKIQEYVTAIDIFLMESGYLISGQNIHVGTGIETHL